MPEECPQEVADVIARCRREPHERPSAKEVFDVINRSPQVSNAGSAGNLFI